MKTTLSYVANIVLIAVIIVMFYCKPNVPAKGADVVYSSGMQQAFKQKEAFAALALTKDQGLVLTGLDGKEGKLCTFNKKKQSNLPLCRGADNILKRKKITIVFSKGSLCGASSDGSGRARQLCWP